MPTIAVVYHSAFGHTKAVAESIGRGAASVDGIGSVLISADELPNPSEDRSLGGRWAELDGADAIIFGCPTYMGSVTAELKRVMEASSAVWMRQGWKDKIAAGFTNSQGLSGDKLNALQDIFHFCQQHSMVWVGLGLMPEGSGPDHLNRISSWMGLMTQSDNAPVEQTPPAGDHRTAEHLGRRVAGLVLRLAD